MLSSILKISLSIVLFSLTIFWNDSLSSFILLKKFSNFIINNLENLFSFNLPRTGINAADNIPNNPNGAKAVDVSIDPNSFSYYPSIFALILLGTIGVLGGIVFLDQSHPELFSNIPVIHTISESITSGFNYIYNTISNRFYPNNNIQPEINHAPNRGSVNYIWDEVYRIFTTTRSATPAVDLPSPISSGTASPITSGSITPTAAVTPTPEIPITAGILHIGNHFQE